MNDDLLNTLIEKSSLSATNSTLALAEIKNIRHDIRDNYATKRDVDTVKTELVRKINNAHRGLSGKEWAGIITATLAGIGAVASLILV